MINISFLKSKLLYDAQDHELLKLIEDVYDRDEMRMNFKNLLNSYFHPRGIKEMAAPKEMRIAYAMVNLLTSLEVGKTEQRIQALRMLRDEVLFSAQSHFQKNTARVLMQIMKELVRSKGDYKRQLDLAHDFREAASGKPRIVRIQLQNYHLLEMPEEWNQLAFDNHVHDAHTKGRKTPTHLIMDAWIKGIRQLTVIYYHYVRAEAAAELMQAAKIMNMEVRIGISVPVVFYNRYARLIWVPCGFFSVTEYLSFLKQSAVETFMHEGKSAAEYQQYYIFAVLDEFNVRHRALINEIYSVDIPELGKEEFKSFVGTSQLSLLHLAEYIHAKIYPLFEKKAAQLSQCAQNVEEIKKRDNILKIMNSLDSENILEKYLRPEINPKISNPNMPMKGPDVPDRLKMSPGHIVKRIRDLNAGYRMILNLSGLTPVDVIELLYDCEGAITHLEIYNLKDKVAGRITHLDEIMYIKNIINSGNVILLKKYLKNIIQDRDKGNSSDNERTEKFRHILNNVATLLSYYKSTPLKSNIGSDSSGRSRYQYGMGMVITDTLPIMARRVCRDKKRGIYWQAIPLSAAISHRTTEYKTCNNEKIQKENNRLSFWKKHRSEDWLVRDYDLDCSKRTNIVTLGGLHKGISECPRKNDSTCDWMHINSGLKNTLKVIIGFIPAFMTFALTKDWWLLSYFGAFIWFAITGLRNILQSVLGGGGIHRSPLLRWNNYISWGRIADSLLFTGFSVPLLDYLVKTLLLDQLLGITVSTNTGILYSVMALVNGLYISSHNAFRGLPKGAIIGNFFRTLFSIPLAIILNTLLSVIMFHIGINGVNEILQKWAAVISKTASDCVAGIIEGLADRFNNIRMRMQDYESKWNKLLETYSQIELLYPESDILEKLSAKELKNLDNRREVHKLRQIMIIHALDFLYFWMYQPRSRTALNMFISKISPDEKYIWSKSQQILKNELEIGQMFLDGVIGKNFAKGLSFYLTYYRKYLTDLNVKLHVNT